MSVIPFLVMRLPDVHPFLGTSSGRVVKISCSSTESLVDVISSIERSGARSGSLDSGVEDVRITHCGHNVSGMSSRGVEGKVLEPDIVEPLSESAGRRGCLDRRTGFLSILSDDAGAIWVGYRPSSQVLSGVGCIRGAVTVDTPVAVLAVSLIFGH